MKQPLFTIVLCSAFGLLGLTGGALADSIRRYDCTIDGTDREPIGDRNGHIIVSLQYTCHVSDGLLKDAGITAISVSEWDSEKGRYLASLDVHRALEGYAVGQLLEGDGSSVMQDNRATGIAAAGRCSNSHPARWRLSPERPSNSRPNPSALVVSSWSSQIGLKLLKRSDWAAAPRHLQAAWSIWKRGLYVSVAVVGCENLGEL